MVEFVEFVRYTDTIAWRFFTMAWEVYWWITPSVTRDQTV